MSLPTTGAPHPTPEARGGALRLSAFQSWLARPVNGASLAIFRFCVGIVMALEAYTLCVPSASTFGQVPLTTFYTGADIKFRAPYAGFEWLPVLPPVWIHVIVGLLAVGGVCLAIGLFHRVAATTVFLSWGYLYALESMRTYWMSYYYLELLVSFLLIWMPASHRWSVDAWLARGKGLPDTVPMWTLVLLRAQLVVTYFYAGVAKVSRDWLIDGEPVRYFLSRARVFEEWAPHLSESQMHWIGRILHSEVTTYFISWVGAGFDLAVGFLLLFRRTRILAMVMVVIFHCTNHFILFKDIHWFPLVGLTTALIFLDPDWPERFGRWITQPGIAKPDWRYFIGGGLALPIVGASLGWSLPATPKSTAAMPGAKIGRWVTPLVIFWLVWQGLSPLRQYIVPADSRLTWEGLSFCWRLKAEVYRCLPGKLFIEDAKVIGKDPVGRSQIDWTQWKGEREVYRTVTPTKLDWSRMPELVVVQEPRLGERVIYNPYSGHTSPRPEKESAARVGQIWRERYGHPPQGIHRTLPMPQIAQAYSVALKNRGTPINDPSEVVASLQKLIHDDHPTEMMFLLRRAAPFALEGGLPLDPPLLVVDDEALFIQASTNSFEPPRLDRAAWKTGPDTLDAQVPRSASNGRDPLLILSTEAQLDENRHLGEVYVTEAQNQPDQPVQLRWNYKRELTLENVMHLSMQPFLLRRYARHVADVWQAEYGRRPAIHAITAVSLNGRPAQLLVQPEADLAAVPVAFFAHNWWIRDLEVPRVPPGGIKP